MKIKSGAEYRRMKGEVQELMLSSLDKAGLEKLDYLSLLVEEYERKTFATQPPDPVTAIRFRMDQLRLSNRDLEPLIGSRSRVSEVLSGKRSLSLDMVRALNEHLRIPAEALIQKTGETSRLPELSSQLKKELVARRLLKKDETLSALIDRAGGPDTLPAPLFRRTITRRANSRTNATALLAWCAAVLIQADKAKPARPFRPELLTATKLIRIARLSRLAAWADAVTKELSDLGIILVVVRHLPETFVDGASLRRSDGHPVVALTLRHDRIDNFWFVLLHELSHIALHFSEEDSAFFDDMDLEATDRRETEADKNAQDVLIPPTLWKGFSQRSVVTAESIVEFGGKIGIHEAIVAGRLRRETGDYRRFSQLIGSGQVRPSFPEEFYY